MLYMSSQHGMQKAVSWLSDSRSMLEDSKSAAGEDESSVSRESEKGDEMRPCKLRLSGEDSADPSTACWLCGHIVNVDVRGISRTRRRSAAKRSCSTGQSVWLRVSQSLYEIAYSGTWYLRSALWPGAFSGDLCKQTCGP